MQIRYYKEYSRYLNRDMEFKVYGCLLYTSDAADD